MVKERFGQRSSPRRRPAGERKREEAVQLGRIGEVAAAGYVQTLGMDILQRNYRCRLGEVDIVARDGNTLCFIEVKARRTSAYGTGLEAVEGRKRAQVRRVATYYLTRFGDTPPVCRFDAVEVWLDQAGHPQRIHLVRNAF
jgi:putative endonuclease